ncbi:GlxA family transcriptional regulator [Agaribacter flavus]|uniref:GlxA family transcriptional regulator n=1 Tax=Agaribacter flavus TaxID=1902781 RepID=A0ABV7FMR7_9ALTE
MSARKNDSIDKRVPKNIGILMYDGMQALDFVSATDTFTEANSICKERGLSTPYKLVTISAGNKTITCAAGIQMRASFVLADCPALHTLIIPGGEGSRIANQDKELKNWLSTQFTSAQRLVSICTGAFILAIVDQLKGKTLATHWRYAELLQKQNPDIKVDGTALHVKDGHIHSSGGLTAGIDLCLFLIEEDLGSDITLKLAREFVVYLKRPGNQAQFSEPLKHQYTSDHHFAELLEWMNQNAQSAITLDQLASRTSTSQRHFSRLFKQYTNQTPMQYLESIRLDKARVLLTTTSHNIDVIARTVGIENSDVFRRRFKHHFEASPTEYRQRFS